MGSKWKEVDLDKIVTFSQGIQVPVEEQTKFKHGNLGRFLRIVDYTNDAEEPRFISSPSKRYYVNHDDIVMIRYGSQTAGKVVRGKSGYIANNMFKIDINVDFITKDFLFLFLSSNEIYNYLMSSQSSSTMPAISFGMLKGLKVQYPELSEQRKITRILLTLDKKITLNRQINQTLEQMAQTLFKSWFVDFDPVIDNALDAGNAIPDTLLERTEQRRLLRAKADFKPLPAETRALFPSEFKETELGWVPKGWNISTTGDEFEVKGGSTPSTANPEFWDDGTIHWTSPKDLSDIDTKILLDTSRKITEAGLKKITSGLLPENTVLMSSRAPVGYLALAKIPVAINQGYIAIPSAKNFTAEYIIQWLDSNMDQIKGMAGGTTFAEISKSTFKTIEILVPTKPVIVEFTKMAKVTFDKITSNVKESSYLSSIRDSLLPKLISGELALDDLPEEIAEAAEAV